MSVVDLNPQTDDDSAMAAMMTVIKAKQKNVNGTIDSIYSLFETALLLGWVDIASYILEEYDSMTHHDVGFLTIACNHGFSDIEGFETLKGNMGKYATFEEFSSDHNVKDPGFYLVKFGVQPWNAFKKFFTTICLSVTNIAKASNGSYSEFLDWMTLRVDPNLVSATIIDKIDLAIGSSLMANKKHNVNILTMYMRYLDSEDERSHSSVAPEEKMIYNIHTILTILEYDVNISDFPAVKELFDNFVNTSSWVTLRRNYSDHQRMYGFEENWRYTSKLHSLPSKESYIRSHGLNSWNKFESIATNAFADDFQNIVDNNCN